MRLRLQRDQRFEPEMHRGYHVARGERGGLGAPQACEKQRRAEGDVGPPVREDPSPGASVRPDLWALRDRRAAMAFG